MLNFTHGFLPQTDPLTELPYAHFAEWNAVSNELSKLALTAQIRPVLEKMPAFPQTKLTSTAQLQRAMAMLSYMAQMYVLAPDHEIARKMPASLAIPFAAVAQKLDRPPILSYASQVLHNWRRLDKDGPIRAENLTLIQNFLGGMDEEWFVVLHMQIEDEAGPGLRAIAPTQHAIQHSDEAQIAHGLDQISESLATMTATLSRMPERCDPDIYFHRVRPFMFGWHYNPDIPEGMIYEGVERFGGKPQHFRGETGAQSSVIYCFDAILGVTHGMDEMREYLLEMREYMPASHRAYINQLEAQPNVRTFIESKGVASVSAPLRTAYDNCLTALHDFRKLHLEFAATYIIKPSRGANKGEVGTGGTPFTFYLKKHARETEERLLSPGASGVSPDNRR